MIKPNVGKLYAMSNSDSIAVFVLDSSIVTVIGLAFKGILGICSSCSRRDGDVGDM